MMRATVRCEEFETSLVGKVVYPEVRLFLDRLRLLSPAMLGKTGLG